MELGSIQTGSPQLYPGYNQETTENTRNQDKQNLSEDQRKQVLELKKRDLEVKAHEAAHMAAGGSCVRGGATYSYQVGPDGNRYAVGGEVSIDTSSVRGDPQATILKMQTVIRAALAPAQPSGQDRSVASQAGGVEAHALKELAQQRTSDTGQTGSEKPSVDSKSDRPENGKPTSKKSETHSYSSNGKARSIKESNSNISIYA
jgi:hypothetical protein